MIGIEYRWSSTLEYTTYEMHARNMTRFANMGRPTTWVLHTLPHALERLTCRWSQHRKTLSATRSRCSARPLTFTVPVAGRPVTLTKSRYAFAMHLHPGVRSAGSAVVPGQAVHHASLRTRLSRLGSSATIDTFLAISANASDEMSPRRSKSSNSHRVSGPDG